MQRPLQQCHVLVLNADFQPLSYFPLSTIPWKEAVKAVFMERVSIVEHYNRFVHSPSFRMRLPSVVALKEYISPSVQKPAFSRFNVFLRDEFTCQYSGVQLPAADLTFDHVIPRSRGGKTTWTNIVTASREANLKKGDLLPRECKMYPQKMPHKPTAMELRQKGKKFPPQYLHETWHDYLYWDAELTDDDLIND